MNNLYHEKYLALSDKIKGFLNVQLESGYPEEYTIPRPNYLSCSNAIFCLKDLLSIGAEPKWISISAEEGIAFSWREGTKDATLEFCNDGEIVIMLSDFRGDPFNSVRKCYVSDKNNASVFASEIKEFYMEEE